MALQTCDGGFLPYHRALNLYAHMLENIEEIYMKEASKIFQVQRACVKLSKYLSIQTLDISLRPDIQDTFQNAFERIKHADASSTAYHKTQATNLRSRCGGLLETQVGTTNLQSSIRVPWDMVAVQYLHHTVSEYIENPGVWNRLLVKRLYETVGKFDALAESIILYALLNTPGPTTPKIATASSWSLLSYCNKIPRPTTPLSNSFRVQTHMGLLTSSLLPA
jgi:hypothetical protein